jgi:purine-binding chemotaxis protein CheW
MKNVLVLSMGGERSAVELRWVREIFSLAALTPVPTAPPVIAGVVNFKGSIVPVLYGGAARPLRPGDTLVLLDVEGVRAALAVDRIDAVTTLAEVEGTLATREGEPVPLLDPVGLLAAAQKMISMAS